jgi:hypothetical protein
MESPSTPAKTTTGRATYLRDDGVGSHHTHSAVKDLHHGCRRPSMVPCLLDLGVVGWYGKTIDQISQT